MLLTNVNWISGLFESELQTDGLGAITAVVVDRNV